MARRERYWQVEVEGFPPITTSELTLDEAALAEQVSGVPWVLMNPVASVKVAKALLVILLKRSRVNAGATEQAAEDEAIKVAGSMPVGTLHDAFTFVQGEEDKPQAGHDGTGPPSSAPTSASG